MYVKMTNLGNPISNFYIESCSHQNGIIFGKAKDTTCSYCEMNDSIIYTFLAAIGANIFLDVIKWFNKEIAPSFSLSPTELILGIKVDISSKEPNIIRKLNFTFLYAKYYLYNQNFNAWRVIGKWIYS